MIARLTVREAAPVARKHPDTLVKLLQLGAAMKPGTLHGTQSGKGGTWTIREDCLEAYLDGLPCAHQSSNVTPIESKRSA